MSLISVDPGQKGAIAHYYAQHWRVYRMPDTVKGIVDMIRSMYATVMVVERAQAMPGQGSVSMFGYGQHYGTFEAVAACLNLSYVTVHPRTWKKAMGLSSDKTDSIREAGRLFPDISLIPEGCRKPSDGLAEALLIGAYALRQGFHL